MGEIGSSKTAPSPPELLTAAHDCAAFCSGEPALDDWLKHRALKSQSGGAARTYVSVGNHVAGYYSLSVGAVQRDAAPGRVRRNMPNPIPVMLLARLAIDNRWQGQGLGRGLLKDAVLRTIQAAEIAGIRAMLVHSISEDAKRFYQYFGFRASPIEAMTLIETLPNLEDALG